MENTPEMRIGDPERSRAIDLLSERQKRIQQAYERKKELGQ